MAKSIKLNDNGVDEVSQPGREARWVKYLARYEASNPVKFASKKENGEFDSIPVSFR